MKINENRKLALVFTIFIIVFSSYFSARNTFKSMQKKADSYFIEGVHQDGFSIRNELEKQCGEIANLSTILKKYPKADSDVISYTNMAIEQFEKADSIEIYEYAAISIHDSFERLCDELSKQELTSKDQDYVTMLKSDYLSSQDIIERDPYYDTVHKMLEKLNHFPAKQLYKISRIQINVFGEVINEN